MRYVRPTRTVCPGYRLVDLKEKFGCLRIRLDVSEDGAGSAVRPLIWAAERDAAVTCEFCGSPGPGTYARRCAGRVGEDGVR